MSARETGGQETGGPEGERLEAGRLEEPARSVVLRSKELYPKAGDKIKYLMEGEWKKVTGRVGRATGKNKEYF